MRSKDKRERAHDPRLETRQNNNVFLARAVRRRTRFVTAVAAALAPAVPARAILLNAHARRPAAAQISTCPIGGLDNPVRLPDSD